MAGWAGQHRTTDGWSIVALYNASYTETELRGLNLPGYRSEAALTDIAGRGDTDWQPVLSLSIFAFNPRTSAVEVLTGIRRDDAPTHPHVISTPTGRFPKAFEAPILDTKRGSLTLAPRASVGRVSAWSRVGIAFFGPNLEELPHRGAPLPFVAHELLARKLGMARGLQRAVAGRPVGTVSLREMSIGFSYVGDLRDPEGNEHPLWEPLLMYAVVMRLDDRGLIPAESAAYRKLAWVPSEEFLAGHERKDPRLLIPGIGESDEASVCVRGLCLLSTRSVITGGGLREHLGWRSEVAAPEPRAMVPGRGTVAPESSRGPALTA